MPVNLDEDAGSGPRCVLCGRAGYLHAPEFNPRLGRGLLVDGAAGLRCAAVVSCAARVGENRRTAPDLLSLPWRTGRKDTGPGAHRVIYAVLGGDPDFDPMIGTMDTAGLSAEACAAHNAMLEGSTA